MKAVIPVLVTSAEEAGAPKQRSADTRSPSQDQRKQPLAPDRSAGQFAAPCPSGRPPFLTPISVALQSLGADDGESRVLGQWMRSFSANGLLRNSSSSPVTWPAPTERSSEGGWPHDTGVLVQSRRWPRHPHPYGWLSSGHGRQECGPSSLCLQLGTSHTRGTACDLTWKATWKVWRRRLQAGQGGRRSPGFALP